jgi:hypothetical protein
MHPRVWLLVCVGWCMVWALPAQASWEAYQQAGEEAYERGDYAIAQRMFLAAVREAKHFGPQDPRLDISLHKLALLRVVSGAYSQEDVHTQHVTRKKSHTRKPSSVRRGHRQPAHSGLRQPKPGRQRHATQSARPGEHRKGTRTTVAHPAHRATRSSATRHVAPPVRHEKRREALQTPHHQQSHTLQRSHTTHHHSGKTTEKRSPARGRHK